MHAGDPPVPEEADRALGVMRRCLGDALAAACLHGSAVGGGLRPASDVDLIALTDQPTTRELRARLVAELAAVSGRHPVDAQGRRPLELILFRRADLAPPAYPARAELVYGEWLREAFEAGAVPEPGADPEHTLLLAQARHEAVPLAGPDPAEWLPEISPDDVRRAIGDALPALLASLDGDERNGLLTLARMWRTLATGEFVGKDVAAEWAAPHLPHEAGALLATAGAAYRTSKTEDWGPRRDEVRALAQMLAGRVRAML